MSECRLSCDHQRATAVYRAVVNANANANAHAYSFAACQPNLVRLDTVTCERSPRRFYASFFRVAVYFIVVLVARIIERRVVDSPAIKQRRYFRQIFPLVVSFDANISSFSLTKRNAFVWSCPERKLEYLEKPEKVKIEK